VKAKPTIVVKVDIRTGRALILTLGVALLVGCFFTDLPDNHSIQLPTHIYVDAEVGSDTSGDGTSATPFRTITKALRLFYDLAEADEDTPRAGSPLTLHVAEGIYNKPLGEAEGIILNNVVLKGEGALRDDVEIRVGIRVVGSCGIEHAYCYGGLTLSQKNDLTTPNAEAIIDDIHADTIYISEFRPEISIINSQLRAIDAGGVYNSITVQGCELVGIGNPIGISIRAEGSITIEGNTIEGVHLYGIIADMVNDGEMLIDSNILTGCNWGGISASAEGAQVRLRDNVISGCAHGPGISINSETDNILESNTVTDCRIGISVGGETSSTVTVIGDNSITGSQDYNILDTRLAHSGVLVIQGIMWDNPQPSGRIDGPTPSIPGTNYYIENEGNSIIFSG